MGGRTEVNGPYSSPRSDIQHTMKLLFLRDRSCEQLSLKSKVHQVMLQIYFFQHSNLTRILPFTHPGGRSPLHRSGMHILLTISRQL
jgi:hypothetical protein